MNYSPITTASFDSHSTYCGKRALDYQDQTENDIFIVWAFIILFCTILSLSPLHYSPALTVVKGLLTAIQLVADTLIRNHQKKKDIENNEREHFISRPNNRNISHVDDIMLTIMELCRQDRFRYKPL